MANFSQWWKAHEKSGKSKQFTWICGSEPVLVEHIVDTVKLDLNPSPWDVFYFNAEEDSEAKIWAELFQYPIGVNPRLVIIREAQTLDRSRLIGLLKNRRHYPNNYAVFVSSEEKIPREDGPDDKTQRPAHLRAFSGKGDVVECGPFTQATASTAVQWVMSLRPMRKGVAAHLLERANGDLRLTRDLCGKLALFPEEPSMAMVNQLLREHPRDNFANALLALDKKTALLALKEMDSSEYSRAIGLLDANLDLAGLVHDMLVAYKTPAEIARAAGSRRFLVSEIKPVARHYDSKRRAAVRRTLCDADETLSRGEHIGVMESIIAFW